MITTATGRPSVRVRGERKAIRRPRRLLRLDFKSRSVQAPGHKGVEHRAENSEEAKHSGKTNRLEQQSQKRLREKVKRLEPMMS